MADGDGGDDGSDGYGTGTGDAFGFGETGDFGAYGWSGDEGDASGGNADAAAAAAGAEAGAAAAAYDGSGTGFGDYGSYGGTAAGDAIAAGYGLAGGDAFGTGTGDAFGFDAGGYVGSDEFGNPVGGLSGYEGFGGADGGIAGAADGSTAGSSLGGFDSAAAWGSYEAGTTAAAVAAALSAQGKSESWISGAIESQGFLAGFAAGYMGTVAAQAAVTAQAVAQAQFGPQSPGVFNNSLMDPYNAVVEAVTKDITDRARDNFQSRFGVDLTTYDPSVTPMSFAEVDRARADPNVNPNPVSVVDPQTVASLLAADIGDQTYTGFDPSGLYGPASPAGLLGPASPTTVDPYFDNPYDPGREDEFAPDPEYDPEAPAINPSPISYSPNPTTPAIDLQSPILGPAKSDFEALTPQAIIDYDFDVLEQFGPKGVVDPEQIVGQVETETLLGLEETDTLTDEDRGLLGPTDPTTQEDLDLGRAITDMLEARGIDQEIADRVAEEFKTAPVDDRLSEQEARDIAAQRGVQSYFDDYDLGRAMQDMINMEDQRDARSLTLDPFGPEIAAARSLDPSLYDNPVSSRFGIEAPVQTSVLGQLTSQLDEMAAARSLNPSLYDTLTSPISPDDFKAAVSLNPALYDVMQSPLGPELEALVSRNPSLYDIMQSPLGPELEALVSQNPALYNAVVGAVPGRADPVLSGVPLAENPVGPLFGGVNPGVFAENPNPVTQAPTAPDFVTAPEERASPGIPASPIGAPATTAPAWTAPGATAPTTTAPDPGAPRGPTSVTVGGTPEAPSAAPFGSPEADSPLASVIGFLGGDPGSGVIPDWVNMTGQLTPEQQTVLTPEMIQMIRHNALNSLLGPMG